MWQEQPLRSLTSAYAAVALQFCKACWFSVEMSSAGSPGPWYDSHILVASVSDHVSWTESELRKLGARVEELGDGMVIAGGDKLKGGECRSHGDHRMAMSLAVAGLVSQTGTTICDVACVNTSFPGFWEMLSSLYT